MTYLIQRKKKKLVNKSNVSDLVKNSDLNTKLATLGTKAELKAEQDKIVKLQIHSLSYFLGKNFYVMMVFRICLFIGQHCLFGD